MKAVSSCGGKVRTKRIVLVLAILCFAGLMISCAQPPTPASESPTDAESAAPQEPEVPVSQEAEVQGEEAAPHEHPAGAAHQDHDPKHGGTFFMALNQIHHLEGVLDPPGVFRVYIYDAYSAPLGRADLEKTEAAVIWGEQDGAPEIPLRLNAEGNGMEVQAPTPVRFPITLTLLVRFPGSAPGSRRELFTFPFSHFTPHPAAHQH
jgi:hypothetical protein